MFSILADKLQDVFKDLRGLGKISEVNISDALREVRMALLEADVHFQVAKDFIARVREKALGEEVLKSVTPGQQIVKIFHDELTVLLGGDASPLDLTPPARILSLFLAEGLMLGIAGTVAGTVLSLIAIFGKNHGELADGRKVKNYYVSESVGIATGMLIAAIHHAGLVSLTLTPSPMGFLTKKTLPEVAAFV